MNHRRNDVVCVYGDVLHPGTPIVVHVLLDLTPPLPRGGLIDWHLHRLLKIRHHYTPQSTEKSRKRWDILKSNSLQRMSDFWGI